MSYTCLSNLSLSYLVFGWSLRAFAAKNGVGVVVMSLHICHLNRGKIKIFFFFLLIEFVLKEFGQIFHFFLDEPFKIKETRAIIPCSLHLQIHIKIVKWKTLNVSKKNSYSGCSSNSECFGPTPVCRQGQCVPGLS